MRHHRAFSALIIACLITLCAFPSDAPAQDQPVTSELVTPYYRIKSYSATKDDAAFARSALDAAIANLLDHFNHDELEPLLRKVRVTVHLHATPTPQANEHTATARTGTRDGNVATYYADIHLLAPSSMPEGLLTSAGLPKDEAYFKRLITHEYSTVPLQLITRAKPEGWRFSSAPSWFLQGYEEYLAYTASPGDQQEAIKHIINLVKQQPDRVRADFGLDVTDPYITGAVLVMFMHEHYGSERVHAILTSPEPSFGAAARASLGVSLEEFFVDWQAWISAQAPP